MSAYSGKPDALDFSFDSVTGEILHANGIVLVSRYLSHTPGKNLTVVEARDLLGHLVGFLFNWESSSGRAILGYAAGVADGRDAAQMAKAILDGLGITWRALQYCIYFSVDFDVALADYSKVADYFRGVRDGMGGLFRRGVYGKADLIEYLHNLGLVTSEWQTYAWSGGRLSPEADLYQYLNGQRIAGAAVDFDKIIHPELLGAVWPPGHAPTGSGNPVEEDDMTPEQDALLHRIGDVLHANTDGLKDQLTQVQAKTDLGYSRLTSVQDAVGAMRPIVAGFDADAIADKVVAKLPLGAPGVPLTRDDVKVAVKAALQEGTG